MEQQGRAGMGGQVQPLGALAVGIEGEAVRIDVLEQHHPAVRRAGGVHGRQRHGVGVVRLGALGVAQPVDEQAERLDAIEDGLVAVGGQGGGIVRRIFLAGRAGGDHGCGHERQIDLHGPAGERLHG